MKDEQIAYLIVLVAVSILVAVIVAEPPPSNSYLPPSPGQGYPQGPQGLGPQGPQVVAARALDQGHGAGARSGPHSGPHSGVHSGPHSGSHNGPHGTASANAFARSGPSVHSPQGRFTGSQEQGYDQNASPFRSALGESSEPANYNFGYMVNDYQEGTDFGHHEERQEERAQGEYHVVLPDGRKQTVSYEADERGFKPHISYEESEDASARSGGYDSNANNVRSGDHGFGNGGGNHGNGYQNGAGNHGNGYQNGAGSHSNGKHGGLANARSSANGY